MRLTFVQKPDFMMSDRWNDKRIATFQYPFVNLTLER